MREHQVIPRGRASAGGSGGAVLNSRHVEQPEVVDLIWCRKNGSSVVSWMTFWKQWYRSLHHQEVVAHTSEQSRRVALPKNLITRLPVQVSQLDDVSETCSRKFCARRDSRMECKSTQQQQWSVVSLCLEDEWRAPFIANWSIELDLLRENNSLF
jgi:hypothetical protein